MCHYVGPVSSILCVRCGCESENVPVASQVDTSKQVLVDCSTLITHCCMQSRLCQVSPYQAPITSCGSSCQFSLDSLVTLSSNHFTLGKFASECAVAFERCVCMYVCIIQVH